MCRMRLLRPRPTAPAIERVRRWNLLMWVLAVVAMMALLSPIISFESLNKLWLGVACIFAIVIVGVTVHLLEERLRARAAAAGWRLCPKCAYPLAGDEGVCPECGRGYTIDGLKDEWLNTYLRVDSGGLDAAARGTMVHVRSAPIPKPPMVLRRLRRWHFLALLCPASLLAMDLAGVHLPRWLFALYLVFVYLGGIVIISLVVRCLEQRLRGRAQAAGWRLCPNCLYPLEGNEGICPECGRAYTIDGLKRDWLSR